MQQFNNIESKNFINYTKNDIEYEFHVIFQSDFENKGERGYSGLFF
jgi:hypothetical protein